MFSSTSLSRIDQGTSSATTETELRAREHSPHRLIIVSVSCLYRHNLERFAWLRLLRGVRGVRGTSRNLREARNLLFTNVNLCEVAL